MLTSGTSSVRRLAEQYDRVVIVLSPDYLDAVVDDLKDAVAVAGSRVLIFGTGQVPDGALGLNWVRVGRHLRETTRNRGTPVINGLDATLLQSTASLVLSGPVARWSSASKVQAFLDDLADPGEVTLEAQARARRRPSTDDEVRAYVRQGLAAIDATPADLLSAWRNTEERQCEEGRFKRLYAEVVEEGTRRG